MRSTKQAPPPQWKEKEEIQVQPDRYYFCTLTLHSETGGDAYLLGPHAIAGCTDIHTAVLTPRHHTVRQGGQLAVHLRSVGSANQPHCGCGSAIAGSTVKRHSLGFMHHLVALDTVQCHRDLARWVWNVNAHLTNACGIPARNKILMCDWNTQYKCVPTGNDWNKIQSSWWRDKGLLFLSINRTLIAFIKSTVSIISLLLAKQIRISDI